MTTTFKIGQVTNGRELSTTKENAARVFAVLTQDAYGEPFGEPGIEGVKYQRCLMTLNGKLVDKVVVLCDFPSRDDASVRVMSK